MYRIHAGGVVSTIVLVLMGGELLKAEENVPVLRYGFQVGKQYAYDVKIQAELENYDEIRSGILSFTVTSAKDKQFVLKPSGNLSEQIKSRPNTTGMPGGFPPFGPMGPRGFMGPRMIMGPGGPQGITINQQGEIIVSRELTHLPYLLGDMEVLMIENLPAKGETKWDKQHEIAVVEHDSSSPFPRFRFGPNSSDDGKHTTAKEKTDYTILKNDQNTVEISKKYALTSSPENDNTSRFEMTGEGRFIFDLKEGLVKSCSMKYECRLNEKNVILKIPIKVNYRILTPEEMAEQQKKAAAAREAFKKSQEPKAFGPGEREKLLADLQSGDTRRMQTAADLLVKILVDDNPEEISKALALMLKNADGWVQKSAANALVVWATPDAENALIKASQSEDVFVRGPALKALGKLKTEEAAEAVAAQMYQQSTRGDAAEALKNMGPIAEEATIALLKDRDGWVRAEACAVLEKIGGEKSLKALRNFTPQSIGFEKTNSKKAISAIESRLASQPKGAVEARTTKSESSSKSSNAKDSSSNENPFDDTRIWRDTTGNFSVEASMLSMEGNIVVLQKKNGKTLRVPINKLSPADRKYIADHAGEAKSKPENPFE